MISVRKVISLAFFLPLLFAEVSAQDVAERERRLISLKKDVELLEKRLKENEAKKGGALGRLDILRAKIKTGKALVAESDREIALFADSIRNCAREIRSLQGRLDTLTAYHARLVRSAYKNRDAKIWFVYILASEDLGQAFRRTGYLKNLSVTMSTQARKISQTRDLLSGRKAELEGLKSRTEAVRKRRQGDLGALQNDEKGARNLVSELGRSSKKYQQEAATKRKEIERLNRELERIRLEAARSAKKSSSASAENIALSKEFNANRGRLPWPARGPVLQGFGVNSYPSARHSVTMKNNGINIALSEGDPVMSVFSGKVIKTFEVKGYGHCIVISHGGYMSMYCRLGKLSVASGQEVSTGEVLGAIGNIGGEIYLHFEICDSKGTPVNPEHWLR